jgi:hypothetical protein
MKKIFLYREANFKKNGVVPKVSKMTQKDLFSYKALIQALLMFAKFTRFPKAFQRLLARLSLEGSPFSLFPQESRPFRDHHSKISLSQAQKYRHFR